MKHCGEWQEALWLDIYGELSPDVRLKWEDHLKECKACYQERIHLLQILKKVNEAVPGPSLSHEDDSALYSAITKKLKKEHHGTSERRYSFLPGHIKPVYALVACCLLMVAFGWFGLKEFRHTSRIETISHIGGEEKLIATEMDLLENLELLEEMDTLEKLDQVMGKGQTKI